MNFPTLVIINVETMVSRLCSSIGLLEPFLLKLAQEQILELVFC
jgi:hypothetical protein